MPQIFQVNLERFSGPYYKILELIEERKLSINEFSLAKITDDYLIFIKNLEKDKREQVIDLSEFIVVASTLMLIKARSLFPNLIYSEEEKKEVGNLEQRLLLYKMMTEASRHLVKKFRGDKFYNLAKPKNREEVFIFDRRLSKIFLHSIALATISKFLRPEKLREVAVQQILKIEEVIENLLTRIRLSQNLSFKDFSQAMSQNFKSLAEQKNALIVSFLAILELVKNGILDASQEENRHNEISLQRQNVL